MRSLKVFTVLAGIIVGVPAVVCAQDLDRARSLYVAAAYEEALAALPAANEQPMPEVEQYRALCLVALGRDQDAVIAFDRLVRVQPMFVLASSDASPRVQALFAAVRGRIIPELAKQSYKDARERYEKGDRGQAAPQFERVVALIDSLPEDARGPLADLRLLAHEFGALSAKANEPKPVDPLPPAPPPVTPQPLVPPVPVREQLPAWNPPDAMSRRAEYVGVLRVQIGEDGRVQSAAIIKRSHPAYDAQALAAAKSWVYKPATRGGRPVLSERDIQVRLIPR